MFELLMIMKHLCLSKMRLNQNNNYKVVKEFIDVETAKRAGRENFNLMIEFLKRNTNKPGCAYS